MIYKLKIDVTKIDKGRLFKGAKGTYLDAVLIEKPDQYGNDGFIKQDVSKEERQAGTEGAIIGNWKIIGEKKQEPPRRTPPSAPPKQRDHDLDPDEQIPF